MRIIGFILLAMVLGGINFPQYALAAEIENQNKNEKIQFEVNENIKLNSNIPYNYDGYEPVNTERDLILSRRAGNLKVYSLPKGKFTANVSAYTASADECGNSLGITASGVKVAEKRTIACPPQYPFGTKIKIEGYGTYVCEDRGGAIKVNKFDIYMKTKSEAFAFGRRNLVAEVVQ